VVCLLHATDGRLIGLPLAQLKQCVRRILGFVAHNGIGLRPQAFLAGEVAQSAVRLDDGLPVAANGLARFAPLFLAHRAGKRVEFGCPFVVAYRGYFIRKGSNTVRAKGHDEHELLGLANTVHRKREAGRGTGGCRMLVA